MVSYRTNASFPLVVSIGFPTREVYAEAWRRTLGNGAIGIILTLVLSLAARLMLRELRRRAAAEGAAAIAGGPNGVSAAPSCVDRHGRPDRTTSRTRAATALSATSSGTSTMRWMPAARSVARISGATFGR